MGSSPLSLREIELARLIAEQESDDNSYVVWQGGRSLDRPLSDVGDAGSLYEVVGRNDILNEDQSSCAETREPTGQEIALWIRRRRDVWTWRRIAEESGLGVSVVRRRVRAYHRQRTRQWSKLAPRVAVLVDAYAGGAKLEEIAAQCWEEMGYASLWSCRQAVRRLLIENGVSMRPGRWKHGMRSALASAETQAEYQRQYYRPRQERLGIRRCEARTRAGKQCVRYGMGGLCVCHRPDPPRLKWTRDRVRDALAAWERAHGRPPRPRDWQHANADHPNFQTVYNLFGSWGDALASHEQQISTRSGGEPVS